VRRPSRRRVLVVALALTGAAFLYLVYTVVVR
jgi:hypothetical protein